MLRNWSLNPLAKVAIGILRSYGTNAHIYLPGIGTVNGITAGNYLDSAGTTAASVDNPVGLSLDALQAMTLGPELVTNGDFASGTTGWTATALSGAPASLSVSGGSLVVTNTGTTYGVAAQTVPVTSGLTYQVTALLTKATAAAANLRVGSTAFGYEYTVHAATGIGVPITATFKATSSNVFISLLNTNTPDGTGIYDNISVREIPGIRATQGTTANKALLKSAAGKYWWQFDGSNDSLSLGAPLFQMSDDHCVIAGANCANVTSSNKDVIDPAIGAGGQEVGRLYFENGSSGKIVARWWDDAGTASAVRSYATWLNTNVIATATKVGNAKSLRVNGVLQGTDSTVMGATTVTSGSIGAYKGTSGYFPGSIYPVIAIKGTVSDAELMVLEKYVGMCCGVSI